MKIRKMLAAAAAAVTSLSVLSFPVSAETGDERPSWDDVVADIQSRHGPFYTLGTDVSAYEPGDITMDGKVDYRDCNAIQSAFNIIVLTEDPNYLTDDQIQLGNVVSFQYPKWTFPIDLFDAKAILRYINFRDILEEPVTMEEAAAMTEKHLRAQFGGE